MQCLARCSADRRSTIKNLYHWWGNICGEIALLGCLNTFASEMSEAHSEQSLKTLSFLRRQCAVLGPRQSSPAEYHKKIISLVEEKQLQGDCSTGYLKLIPTNHQIKLSFLQRQCAGISPAECRPAEYHKKIKSLVGKYLRRDFPAGVLECFCK
jgi:hypothetical protein